MLSLLLFQFLGFSCCFRDRVGVCSSPYPVSPHPPSPVNPTCSPPTCSNPKAINSACPLDPKSPLWPWWTHYLFL